MSDMSSIDLDEISTSGGETDQEKAPTPEKEVVKVSLLFLGFYILISKKLLE